MRILGVWAVLVAALLSLVGATPSWAAASRPGGVASEQIAPCGGFRDGDDHGALAPGENPSRPFAYDVPGILRVRLPSAVAVFETADDASARPLVAGPTGACRTLTGVAGARSHDEGLLLTPWHKSIAARGAAAGEEAFHYTFSRAISSIEQQGLRAGPYATPNGALSPLQAQIDLALAPNRGLPDALLRIDLAGLRQAGYEIPEITQVPRTFGMPGGGFEMQFSYSIPPEFITVVQP